MADRTPSHVLIDDAIDNAMKEEGVLGYVSPFALMLTLTELSGHGSPSF